MTVEVSKYIRANMHPLAPFTIHIQASTIKDALHMLEMLCQHASIPLKREEEVGEKKEKEVKKEEVKKEVKEEKKAAGRNPLTCIRARRLVQMTGGRVSMVKYTCPKYLVEEREDFKPSEDFDQCLKCTEYIYTDLRLR